MAAATLIASPEIKILKNHWTFWLSTSVAKNKIPAKIAFLQRQNNCIM
jgi:hypothetical protein